MFQYRLVEGLVSYYLALIFLLALNPSQPSVAPIAATNSGLNKIQYQIPVSLNQPHQSPFQVHIRQHSQTPRSLHALPLPQAGRTSGGPACPCERQPSWQSSLLLFSVNSINVARALSSGNRGIFRNLLETGLKGEDRGDAEHCTVVPNHQNEFGRLALSLLAIHA